MFNDDLYNGFAVGDKVRVFGYGGKTLKGKIIGVFVPSAGSSDYFFCVDVGTKMDSDYNDLTECAVGAPNLWDRIRKKMVVFCAGSPRYFHHISPEHPRMTFAEVLEFESRHAGAYFKRVDDDFRWCLQFDPKNAGVLRQFQTTTGKETVVELYHHDFVLGLFRAYKNVKCSEPFVVKKRG